MDNKALRGMLRETGREWVQHDTSRLAAAVAYYSAVSLAPVLVLVVSLAGLVLGDDEQVRATLLGAVRSAMGADASRLMGDVIRSAARDGGGIVATVGSVAVMVLGATGVFGQLKGALNEIWETEPTRYSGIWALVRGRFLSFAMVVGVSFMLLTSLAISAALTFVSARFGEDAAGLSFLPGLLEISASVVVTTFVFAAIFKVLPDTPVRWRDVWTGAAGSAVLFTVGKELLSIYVGRSSAASVYGAAGALVVILIWVYYSAQIMFLGGEFSHAWSLWAKGEART